MSSSPLRSAAPEAPGPLAACNVDVARHATPEAPAPAMLMTADDLARELRVSVKTIRCLDQSGRLPRKVKVGHAARWPRETIVAWILCGAPPRAEWEAFYAAPTAKGRGRHVSRLPARDGPADDRREFSPRAGTWAGRPWYGRPAVVEWFLPLSLSKAYIMQPHVTPRGDDAATDPLPPANANGDGAGVSPLASPAASAAPDPFDPARYRLSQDFASAAPVRPIFTSIAVDKPNPHVFVRVRPGEDWRFPAETLADKSDNKRLYLVDRGIIPFLPVPTAPTLLLLTIGRNSPVPFFWPCFLPSPDGRTNRWHESAIEAAREAESRWLRVTSDLAAGCYVPYVAQTELPEPEWPDLSRDDLLCIAFRGRVIDAQDHPVLRRLRREA